MLAGAKFIFDTSFDTVDEAKGPSALDESYAKGLEEGKLIGHGDGFEEAMGSIEIQILNVMQTFKDELTQVYEQFDTLVESNMKYSLSLIEKIASKLFVNLPKDMLVTQIINILKEALPLVIEQRKLILYVNPELVEPFKKRLAENPELTEISRRLDCIGSELLQSSDCKIAWSKGALEVNPAETWEKILALINAHKIHDEIIAQPELPEVSS